MLFLDDFLEMLDELPVELKDRSDEIRRIDVEVEARLNRNREAVNDFFDRSGVNMSEEDRKNRFKVLQDEYAAIRNLAQRKYVIAEKMQELLKKYQTHLEKEKTNFQCEMEADNSGVTEMIEKRYTQHVEQALVARKERKRRHRVGSSRASTVASGPLLSTKESNEKITRILQEGLRLRMDLDSDSAHSALSSAIPSPAPRGRPPKVAKDPLMLSSAMIPSDDCMTPVPTPQSRRRSNTNALRGTVSIPSAMSGMNRESSGRYSPNPSERSWSNAGIDESPTPTVGLTTPTFSSGPHTATPSHSGLLHNSAFVVSESRHGRTRKLTSRVQEMFKETLQRQRNHGNSIIALQERMSAGKLSAVRTSPNISQSPTPRMDRMRIGSATDDDEEDRTTAGTEDEEEENEDDANAKSWCFCNEKSYGDMVRCDNEECTLRWFHYPCIGMVEPPGGKWYCPRCVVTLEMADLNEMGEDV